MGKNQQKNANSELLEQIRTEIIEKNICPDLAKEATNLVMGVGDDNADILFIGEAPGKNEDLQGEPFVGAAGKFLDEMLAQIGLSRNQVYITNIVKYRPPNNRDPLPEEKKAFWPYLIRQIMVIQPKIIVTLGRHSMEYFLPDRRITQIHGQPKRIRMKRSGSGGQHEDGVQGATEKRTEPYQEYGEGVAKEATKQSASKLGMVSGLAGKQDELMLVILPLYHPAAALYNSSLKETLINDFKAIPKVIKLINNNQ
jgi:DNA polymerase